MCQVIGEEVWLSHCKKQSDGKMHKIKDRKARVYKSRWLRLKKIGKLLESMLYPGK